jgi:hypothetical protein
VNLGTRGAEFRAEPGTVATHVESRWLEPALLIAEDVKTDVDSGLGAVAVLSVRAS